MGIAEVLPGISGGTVAYMTGIYKRLIDSIAAYSPSELSKVGARNFWTQVRPTMPFLVPLGIGMLIGLASTIVLVSHLLETHALEIWGLIFGLMAGAVVQLGRDTSLRNLLTFGIFGFFLGIYISWLNANAATVEDPSYVLVLIGGFVAFTAWIMPGVSGSMMLLILGVWSYMIKSFAGLVWIPIVIFCCGLLLSAIFVPPLLKTWLENHQGRIVAVFCGLLLGSLFRVWPWQHVVGYPILPEIDSDPWQAVRIFTLMVGSFSVMMTVVFYERQRKCPR